MILLSYVREYVLSLVFQRVPVKFGGEEKLGWATRPGAVVRRRLAGMVDGHVRLEAGGRGEYRRAEVAREGFAAGERVLDQVRLESVSGGKYAWAQAALDAVHGAVQRGQMRAQMDRGFLLRLETDLSNKGTRTMKNWKKISVQ